MLTKDDLFSLGYEINPDPDQPGFFLWRNDQEGSEISFSSEAEALDAAATDARSTFELYRCANCGKVHSDQTMVHEVRRLTERICPGDVVPEGECPDCGAFCFPLEKEPDWPTVMDYFGLDGSFEWSPTLIADYTRRYGENMDKARLQAHLAAKAIAFVNSIAMMKKWGESDEEGNPFSPSGGLDDSHECLMDIIEDARRIVN